MDSSVINQQDYTVEAWRIVQVARRLASQDGHDRVCTVHFLRATIEVGRGIGFQVIRELAKRRNMRVSYILERAKEALPPTGETSSGSSAAIPFSKKALHLLECAECEREAGADEKISTEHLALAFVHDRGQDICQANLIILEFGANLDHMRMRILELKTASRNRSKDKDVKHHKNGRKKTHKHSKRHEVRQ